MTQKIVFPVRPDRDTDWAVSCLQRMQQRQPIVVDLLSVQTPFDGNVRMFFSDEEIRDSLLEAISPIVDAETVENAMKAVLLNRVKTSAAEREDEAEAQGFFIVSFEGAFHGRTLGSLAATHRRKARLGFPTFDWPHVLFPVEDPQSPARTQNTPVFSGRRNTSSENSTFSPITSALIGLGNTSRT